MLSDPNRRQPIPLDLVRLAEASTAYLECLRAALPAVIRLGESGNFLRDQIDGALKPTEWGTVAAVDLAVRELIES
jgi:hypothetical protein